ncbi:MAG: glycosyltransferase family 2 protein, partial [Alistipes sp.]
GVGVTVADNGSTDGSMALLERDFPTVRRIYLDRNYGFAEGYNRALELVNTDFFVLLNSDVETPNGWLEPILQMLEQHADVAAAAPKLLSYDERTTFEYAGAAGGYIDFLGYPFCRGRILCSMEKDEGQYDDERDVFWVSGAAFCCRADVFRALGGFDVDFFAHMEEIDLCWRMQLAGYRVRIMPRSAVYHLGGGTLASDSPTKVFYNHRNNLAMLYKCASPMQRATVAIVRPLLDFVAALSYLAQGRWANFRAVGRAYCDFMRWHGVLAAKRRAIRTASGGSAAKNIYCGSILWRYFCGRRTFKQLM